MELLINVMVVGASILGFIAGGAALFFILFIVLPSALEGTGTLTKEEVDKVKRDATHPFARHDRNKVPPLVHRFELSMYTSEQAIHDAYQNGKISGRVHGIELERFRTQSAERNTYN